MDITTIGQYHYLFLQFPVVLFTAALAMDLLNYFGKSRALYIGHWLVIAGVVMCIPTIITGLAASAAFDLNDPFVARHRLLGYSLGVCGSLYAGLRISVMCWKLTIHRVYYLMMSVTLVALVLWTSNSGDQIARRPEPAASVMPAPTT